MALHTGTHNGDLGAGGVHAHIVEVCTLLQHAHGQIGFALRAGKADILLAVTAGGLQDDVHVDVLLGQQTEDLEAHARLIGNVQNRDNSNISVFCDTLDQHTFHVFCNLLDHRTGHGIQAGEHLQLHIILFGQLHAAVVQHLCTQRCQLQHLVKGDLIQLAGVAHLARVGRVNAFHIGKDLAAVCVQGCCNGNSAGVGAAAAQSGDVIHLVQALEARHNDHTVALQLRRDALCLQAGDARLGIGAVGAEASLPAGQADGMAAQLIQCHGQQRNADLLAAGQQHIHFTGRRVVGDLPSLGDQVIGGIALSGHHHYYVIARVVGVCHNACHVEDTVTVLHRRTAELLYDQRHILSLSSFCPFVKRGTPGGSGQQRLALPLPIYHSTVAPVLSASKRSNVNASHPSRPSSSSRPFSSLE